MNQLLGSVEFFCSLLREFESAVVMEEKKRVIEGAAVVNLDLELSNLNSVDAPAAFLIVRAIDIFPDQFVVFSIKGSRVVYGNGTFRFDILGLILDH